MTHSIGAVVGTVALLFLAVCSAPLEGRADAAVSASTASVEAPLPDTLPELLPEIEAAYRGGKYDRGLALVKKALELKQNDVSAMDSIGTIYYRLGRYGEALTTWSRALPLERDLQKRRQLEASIAVARRTLGLGEEAGPKPASSVDGKASRKPPAKRPADKAEVKKLYKRGIKYYAEGQYLQATTAFLRVLELDPGNEDAKKALQRLKLDPASGSPATAP